MAENNTAGAVKTETSKKIRQKKTALFFPDFFYMRCPCPFLQVDGVSLCLDSVLSSKSGISVFKQSSFRVLRQCFQKVTKFTFW
jgi:hypothetical protein